MEESPQQTPRISETDKNPNNRWIDGWKVIQGCLEQRGGANPQSRPPGATDRRWSTVFWKCHQSGHIRRDCEQGDGEPGKPANPTAIPSNPAVTPRPTSFSPGINGTQAPPAPINVSSVYKTRSLILMMVWWSTEPLVEPSAGLPLTLAATSPS